jgi:Tol biopolymer transport system component
MLSRLLALSVFTGTCALALLLAGCGGGDSTTPAAEPVTAPFVSVAQSNDVGAAGGSVSLTAADGTQYTLDVPAGALATTTTLSLTTAAPATGQRFRVVAGPDGLLFKSGTAATLTIRPPSGRELPASAGLLYSGSPVSSTRNADGSIAMKLYQLRGSATPITALAQLAKLSQALTRLLPAEAVDNSVLVCRSPNVNGGPAAGVASFDQLDFERFVTCTYDQIDDLIAASDFNTALALAQLLESIAQRNNADTARFVATAKSLVCTGRQRSLDTLASILIQSPEDVLVIESVAYWDMMVQKLGGATCPGQPTLVEAVQPKIDDALTLLDADFATASAAAIDSTGYTSRKTTAVKTVTLRERLLTISVALGIPPAPQAPAAVRETPLAVQSPYTAANIATTQVQGRLEPSMLKNLLPTPWSRCRTAGDYAPLMALSDVFGNSDSLRSAAQYCATQLSAEVLDNQNHSTASLSGLGGVAAGQNQTSASVQATADGVLRLTGPIGALRCPANVASTEELVIRFAGVEVRRLSAAPYLGSALQLNISELRTAAGLAAGNLASQPLVLERVGAACADYWGPAPAPLISVTIVFAGEPKIAYTTLDGGLFVVNPDGTGLLQLAGDAAVFFLREGRGKPGWSPDHQKIAYSVAGDLYIINADGTGRVSLGLGGFYGMGGKLLTDAVWSPDGTRIAYTKYDLDTDSFSVCITTPIGGGGSCSPGALPTWAPDSTRFAYTAVTQVGTNELGAPLYAIDLFVGGANQTNFLANAETQSTAWSPDGTQIAYTGGGTLSPGIYLTGPGGGAGGLLRANAGYPAWSPDGRKLVFITTNDQTPTGTVQIMNKDGSGVTSLGITALTVSW